jgi:hypothetical protein
MARHGWSVPRSTQDAGKPERPMWPDSAAEVSGSFLPDVVGFIGRGFYN